MLYVGVIRGKQKQFCMASKNNLRKSLAELQICVRCKTMRERKERERERKERERERKERERERDKKEKEREKKEKERVKKEKEREKKEKEKEERNEEKRGNKIKAGETNNNNNTIENRKENEKELKSLDSSHFGGITLMCFNRRNRSEYLHFAEHLLCMCVGLLKRSLNKGCLPMMNEAPIFPKLNYPNPKEFLSTHGYDAPPLLLLMIRDAHIVSH
uniref:Uncharacterized protein n=1 Tax=Octopus bimaculoides TaxID=37653 RepID=A0A0L8HZY0_OCTBM